MHRLPRGTGYACNAQPGAPWDEMPDVLASTPHAISPTWTRALVFTPRPCTESIQEGMHRNPNTHRPSGKPLGKLALALILARTFEFPVPRRLPRSYITQSRESIMFSRP